jgi:hypothetical protein
LLLLLKLLGIVSKLKMNCCNCNSKVEEGRASLGLTVCLTCARNGVAQPDIKKGYQMYGHKTGDEICIVSKEAFADMRRLNPYGKNTGRGSGVHVVSKKTSSI